MDCAVGKTEGAGLRVKFDGRLKLGFHGFMVTSDAGLYLLRELDDTIALLDLA